MENFITGYPGHEYQARAALKKILGAEKYEFFFDKVRDRSMVLGVHHLCSRAAIDVKYTLPRR